MLIIVSHYRLLCSFKLPFNLCIQMMTSVTLERPTVTSTRSASTHWDLINVCVTMVSLAMV